MSNVFDNQNFPPGATLNKVDPYVYQPEVTEEIIVGSATGPRKEFKTTLEESTVDALELFVPGIMIEPIRVPSGEGFAKSLDKIINLLDTRKKSDRPVGKEEFINFFENKEIFDRYNPIEQKDQTNIKADTTKKKFG